MPKADYGAAAVTAFAPGDIQAGLEARLTTRISRDVDRRLRLAAVLQNLKLGEFLDSLLSQSLPTYADLSVQMNGATSDEH